MTEALAFLLATFAACGDPSFLSAHTSTSAIQFELVRVAWDPETNTWGAMPPAGTATLDRATSLGGPTLPFEAPVEFSVPGGGRAIALGKSGMETVRVVRGKDGRFYQVCEPANEPTTGAPDSGPTDR